MGKRAKDTRRKSRAAFKETSLLARIVSLEKEVKQRGSGRKDIFDRISQLSTLISGVLIAGVGAIATIYFNLNQDQRRELEAIDKFRTYLSEQKSPQDRKFGYYALVRLGQEKLAIDLITMRRDTAGEDVLTNIALNSKDEKSREAARKGIAVLRSNRPGCKVEYTLAKNNFVNFLNGWELAHLTEIVIPQLAKVKDGPKSGKIRFNILAADALRDAWAEVEQKGLLDRVTIWGGAYVPKAIRGSTRLSVHACGLAFDINYNENPFGRIAPAGSAGSVYELVPIFEKHGFKWGGNFNRPDAAHFEYVVPENAKNTGN